MKPTASINLPQWIPVVWIAAALSIGAFFFESILEKDWGKYISIASTLTEILLWETIIRSLKGKGKCKTALSATIFTSLFLQLVLNFFSDSIIISLISFVSWVVALILIIKNYSGTLKKYAITEIICASLQFIAIIVLAMIVEGASDSSDLQTTLRIIMCAIIILIYYPYKVLAEALKENEAEEPREE